MMLSVDISSLDIVDIVWWVCVGQVHSARNEHRHHPECQQLVNDLTRVCVFGHRIAGTLSCPAMHGGHRQDYTNPGLAFWAFWCYSRVCTKIDCSFGAEIQQNL